jgi:hypothetical protein
MAGKNSVSPSRVEVPDMARHSYEPVLSAKAWEFFGTLSRKRQLRISRIIYQLADCPHHLGDYQTLDSTWRTLENLRLEGYIFTYWSDAAVKELRILDIVHL